MAENMYDLRSFITRLDEEGELARVKAEVDWKYELGAIARRVCGPPPGPALLFEKVKDYTIPVFVGGLHTVRRIAIALGLDPQTDEPSLVKEYLRRLENPIKPTIVKNGPCKENKYLGKEVDVLKFPVPWWNEKDGGRYVGTLHQVVTKDLETGWTNVGIYRMMVHEPNVCGIIISPFQHIGQMYRKYQKVNRPMPVAVSIGNDPVAILASASAYPGGVEEWSMAGALRGSPVELVKCETVDLEVPSHSEIVLEGEIPPHEERLEGPFGEHTGFYGAGIRPLPILKVNCITHRNNPIFRGTSLGIPVTEQHRITSFGQQTAAMAMYQKYGFPGVTAVSCPTGGDPDFCAVVAISKSYASHGLDAGRLLLSSKAGKLMKHIIVVDDDIDAFDFNQVLWAINTRVQASRDIYITRGENGSKLDASVPYDYVGYTDKMVIDATWPIGPDFKPRDEWDGGTHPPKIETSEEMQKLMEKRWAEYGIG